MGGESENGSGYSYKGMIYLLVAILVCCVSGYLFKIGCGTISLYRPNMMSVIFYYYFVLQCVIGAVMIVNNWEEYNWELNALVNQNVRVYGFWVIMYTVLMFPVGMLIANVVFREKRIATKFREYCKSPIEYENVGDWKTVRMCAMILSIISLLSVLYVIRTVGEIGLFKMFSSDSAMDLAGFRMESGRGFTGNPYIRSLGALFLCPILCYVSYGYKRKSNTIINRVWFWSMFMGSVLILTSSLEKAPVLIFLVGFLFFRIYTGKPLTKKILILTILGLAVVVSVLYILIMKTETDQLAGAILNRMTISSVGGLYLDLDIFPSRHDFLGVSSFSSEVNALFGVPHDERASRICMMIVKPEMIASGQAGVINCLFTGEAWANWGWYGLLLSPVWVGFLIQSFYLLMLSYRKTPLMLAIFVKYSFVSSVCGGINDYFYNTSVTTLLILVLGILLIAELKKRLNGIYNDIRINKI